jgi:hypothetical protein
MSILILAFHSGTTGQLQIFRCRQNRGEPFQDMMNMNKFDSPTYRPSHALAGQPSSCIRNMPSRIDNDKQKQTLKVFGLTKYRIEYTPRISTYV